MVNVFVYVRKVNKLFEEEDDEMEDGITAAAR
jgi:hypothetical protein